MGLRADDLTVGQWVAVEREISDEPCSDGGPFWFGWNGRRESKVDGTPLRIVAISLPFVCVTNGRRRFVLDTREVVFCRLTPKFVKSLSANRIYDDSGAFVVRDDAPKQRVNTEKPERACPVCSDRLIERYAAGVWCLACRQCGFTGGRGAIQ